MMRKILQRLVPGMAIMMAGPVFASPQITGALKEVWVNDGANSNMAWIQVDATFTSSCGNTSGYLVIDLSESGMKEAYALALSAFLAERNVRAAGNGACLGGYEKLKYIYMSQ